MFMQNQLLQKEVTERHAVVPATAAQLHVAVICDGNGRWATSRFLPRSAGHRAGAVAVFFALLLYNAKYIMRCSGGENEECSCKPSLDSCPSMPRF